MKAPIAKIKNTTLVKFNDKRIDPYYWMNKRDSEDVLDYLNAENSYYKAITEPTKNFEKRLFKEMKSRIKEDDESVPYKKNGYWYIVKYEQGKEYPIYTRKKETLVAKEEVLFDCNQMAKNQPFFNLRGISISPDNTKVAYGTDTVGRRMYTIYVKNLTTGEILSDKIENATGSSAWANDNKTFFYTKQNLETLRSEKIFKHVLGVDSQNDTLVFHETDDTFNTYVYRTNSDKYIVIGSGSTLTTEFRFLSADNPNGVFSVFQKRLRGLEYYIGHVQDQFYILTNIDKATNFKLMKASESQTEKTHWQEVIPHREKTLLTGFEVFKNYLVVEERTKGLDEIRVMNWDKSEDYYLPFDSETYTAGGFDNVDFDTDMFRYSYSSMISPNAVIDFNLKTKEKKVLREQKVLGGQFDKNNYQSERVWAIASDGTKIPISLVYRKGMKRDGANPTLLYGYGSYGHTISPVFSSIRLSLLDRGFVFAIAHVRGGEYMGRQWYDNGKLLTKKNTFTDFIACGEHLVLENYTSPKHLYALGGSAGGLLMGAVINIAPNLFNGVIANVPFVDVVTTMLDESIPLTTGEYDEWGNPNKEEFYHYMKSYSPYDNVEKKDYPNLFVITGYHDSQVQYWEPAKWVAKLRNLKTDQNKLLFHINMDAGHGGASGRFQQLKEIAMEYTFLLNLEGIHE